jgi:hypothetical protein
MQHPRISHLALTLLPLLVACGADGGPGEHELGQYEAALRGPDGMGPGAACKSDTGCADGLFCSSLGKCLRLGVTETPCGDDADCDEGLVCDLLTDVCRHNAVVPSRPVAYLEQTAAGSAPCSSTFDSDEDGEPEGRVRYIRDADGRPILTIEEGGDCQLAADQSLTGQYAVVCGPPNAVVKQTAYEWTTDGRIASIWVDEDGDSVWDARTGYTYDPKGYLQETEEDQGIDGSVDGMILYDWVGGKLVGSIALDGATGDALRSTMYHYDAAGRLDAIYVDEEADGDIDEYTRTLYALDGGIEIEEWDGYGAYNAPSGCGGPGSHEKGANGTIDKRITYFRDGNGRLAGQKEQWFLAQKGYSATQYGWTEDGQLGAASRTTTEIAGWLGTCARPVYAKRQVQWKYDYSCGY